MERVLIPNWLQSPNHDLRPSDEESPGEAEHALRAANGACRGLARSKDDRLPRHEKLGNLRRLSSPSSPSPGESSTAERSGETGLLTACVAKWIRPYF